MILLGSAMTHGGPDAQGDVPHDFSTNANALGPCPTLLERLRSVVADRYPDPTYRRLIERLADWHGGDPQRIFVGASGSELIGRMTAAMVALAGHRLRVVVPRHAYGDYARAAAAWGLPLSILPDEPHTASMTPAGALDAESLAAKNSASGLPSDRQADGRIPVRVSEDAAPDPAWPRLIWACEPTSPLGGRQAGLEVQVDALRAGDALVLDRAYAPLLLDGSLSLDAARLDRVWQLHSPNKALGMTGVRGAWLVAPVDAPEALGVRLRMLEPSWPLGAHAVDMLTHWTEPCVQQWLSNCLPRLRALRQAQVEGLTRRGWRIRPSQSNFFCARPPDGDEPVSALLTRLRRQGIKLRDAASFGLAGELRLGVRRMQDQEVLWYALDT